MKKFYCQYDDDKMEDFVYVNEADDYARGDIQLIANSRYNGDYKNIEIFLSKEDAMDFARSIMKTLGEDTLKVDNERFVYGIKQGKDSFMVLFENDKGVCFTCADVLPEGHSHTKHQKLLFEEDHNHDADFKAYLKHPKAVRLEVSENFSWDLLDRCDYLFDSILDSPHVKAWDWINDSIF